MIGPHCPVNLPSLDDSPYVVRLSHSFDAEGFERGERINGFHRCPRCRLWWPCIEEPDCWEQRWDGKWKATDWWGAVVCSECDLLIVQQPDGRGEVYQL